MTVGQRIREKRIELGLTQEELAFKMGYSGKSSVCAAEICGDNITTTKVQKFATALGVSPIYLMFGTDDDAEKQKEDIRKLTAFFKDKVNKFSQMETGSNDDVLKQILALVSNNPDEIREFLNFYNAFKNLPKSKRDAIRALLEFPQSDS